MSDQRLQPVRYIDGAHAAEVAGLAVAIYDGGRLATLILRDRQVIALGPDDLEAQAAMLREAAARLRAQHPA